MSGTRFEPVAQRDETIILESINGSPHYNYNFGLPQRVASSRYEPSIISIVSGGPPPPPSSIPNSPPPSFHTHSSPGTPRPTTPSTTTRTSHHESAPSYAELWGVAPSTFGGGDTTNTNTIGTSNDALATITGLKQRIEWLEESIGRLLMEKDSASNRNNADSGSGSENGEGGSMSTSRKEGDNCCVTFTDASPDLERALTSGKGTNCCVMFRSKGDGKRNKGPWLVVVILFMVCMTVVLVAEAGSKKQYRRESEGDGSLIK